MADALEQPTQKRERSEPKPRTEVGLIFAMEEAFLRLPDDDARQRATLYFALRSGFDARTLLSAMLPATNGEPQT